MSENILRIRRELESMGYSTSLHDSGQGQVITFTYKVEVGSHKGKKFKLGISMHGSGLYPEYPPHWIHLSPPINDNRGGAVEHYEINKEKWVAMSRPPGALWDQLPTKTMHAYLQEHLRSFWNGL